MVTNVEMDHHSRWARWPSCASLPRLPAPAEGAAAPADGSLATWSRAAARRFAPRPRVRPLSLAVPGRHNLLNARAALAAIELAGSMCRRRSGARRRSRGVRQRLELKGARRLRERRRRRPPPDRGAGGLARAAGPGAPDRRLRAGLDSGRRRWRGVLRRARGPRRRPCSTSMRSRGAGRQAGVSGAASRQAAVEGWGGSRPVAPRCEPARRALGAHLDRNPRSARAGSWSRSAPATSSSLAEALVEEGDDRLRGGGA